MATIFLFYAGYDRWWGGHCFGPRYLTDLLPLLAFFLVPVWPLIKAAPLLRIVFFLSVAAALWVQVVGVYYYPMGKWDSQPLSVDAHPERLWDWADTQLSRSWRKGPAPADVYIVWREFLTWRKRGPH